METLNLVIQHWIEFELNCIEGYFYQSLVGDSWSTVILAIVHLYFPLNIISLQILSFYFLPPCCGSGYDMCYSRGNSPTTPNTNVERNAFPENCTGWLFTECYVYPSPLVFLLHPHNKHTWMEAVLDYLEQFHFMRPFHKQSHQKVCLWCNLIFRQTLKLLSLALSLTMWVVGVLHI